MEYNFQQIEKKWQRFWARNQVFKAYNNSKGSIQPKVCLDLDEVRGARSKWRRA